MWGSSPGPPRWGLSPLRSEDPGSPPPATPSALYRSCFATECEAIALQLGRSGCGEGRALPTPLRGALTVEAETLTPLEAAWSFLGEPPPGPSEEAEPPPPSARPAPSSPANRTYDAAATSLCEASGAWFSQGQTAAARLDDDKADAHRTFERQLPGEASVSFVASTPVPSTGGFFRPTAEEDEEDGAEATRPSGSSFFKARLAPWKDAASRKSLVGGQAASEAAPPPGARSSQRKGPQAAGADRPETAEGVAAAAKSQPLGQKRPDERKNNLSRLHCNKKPPMSARPPSRPSRGPGAGGSLTGLTHPGVGRENKSVGTRLPVRAAAGGNKTAAKPSPQRPLGRHLVRGSASPQKQSTSKRSCPGKSCIEKPTCGVLRDAGQIPSVALSRPTAPCSQCQQLAEENLRLKTMLEDCERVITVLKRKKKPEEED